MSADPMLLVVEDALRALDAEPVLVAGSDGDDVAAQVRAAARPGAAIGALGVLDDLAHPAPLVEALRAAAADGATVALTVPNTPYTGRGTAWDASAVEELAGQLGAPGEVVVRHVAALTGAALVVPDEAHDAAGLQAVVPAGAVPVLAVLAAGPRAPDLAPAAAVHAADLAAERAARRALEADVAFLAARVAELEAQAAGRDGLAAPAPAQLPA